VVLAAVEQNRLGEVTQFAINADTEALPVKLVKQFLEFTLAPADDGRHHGDALAAAQFENALDDLVSALVGDRPSAVRAVWRANRGVEQAQVVVDLGDGAHG